MLQKINKIFLAIRANVIFKREKCLHKTFDKISGNCNHFSTGNNQRNKDLYLWNWAVWEIPNVNQKKVSNVLFVIGLDITKMSVTGGSSKVPGNKD